MSKVPDFQRATIFGIVLAAACLVIQQYSIDSSVVHMELTEPLMGKYVAVARVNVPDFNKEVRGLVRAIREGGSITNVLPHFEAEKRLDLQLVRSRSRMLGLVPLTESLEVEVEISIDKGDGTRSVRQHHADSMIELNPDEARMQEAAIEELKRLGYQRAVDLLSSGEYSAPARIKFQGVLLLLGAVFLPTVVSCVIGRVRAAGTAAGSRSTTPLPSPTTLEDSQT